MRRANERTLLRVAFLSAVCAAAISALLASCIIARMLASDIVATEPVAVVDVVPAAAAVESVRAESALVARWLLPPPPHPAMKTVQAVRPVTAAQVVLYIARPPGVGARQASPVIDGHQGARGVLRPTAAACGPRPPRTAPRTPQPQRGGQ